MKTDAHILKTKETIQHNVNLNHMAQQGPQIAREGKVIVDRRKFPLIDWILESCPQKPKMHLELEVIPSPALIIRNTSKLLRIYVTGENQTDNEFTIRRHETPYIVKFYPDEIIDCDLVETCGDGSEHSVFPINYKIILKRGNIIIDRVDCFIEIRIEPMGRVEPEVSFFPSEEFKDGVVYSKKYQGPVTIGHFKVKNSGKFYRCPALNASVGINGLLNEDIVPNLLCFGDKTTITGNHRPVLNPRLNEAGGGKSWGYRQLHLYQWPGGYPQPAG